jgi:hypothetical protein
VARRSRIHETFRTSESRGNGDCGDEGGEKSGDSAIWQESVPATERGVVTVTEERLQQNQKCLRGTVVGGGIGTARPNPTCDEGLQGPLNRNPRRTARHGPNSVLQTAFSGRRTSTLSHSSFSAAEYTPAIS